MSKTNLRSAGNFRRLPIRISLCLAWLFAIALAGTSTAADLFVDDDSTCAMACGSATLPFRSLQQAIDAAVDGDVVRVQPGDYVAGNVLAKSVSIVGEGSPRIVIGSRETGLTVSAGVGMEVSGISFVSIAGSIYSSGLTVSDGVDQFTVNNNSFQSLFNGSYVSLNRGVVDFDGNDFTGNTNALSISLRYYTIAKKVSVTNNNFSGNSTALSGGATPKAEELYVYHNNFIGNTNQSMPYGSQVPNYQTGGNYWSHLTPSDVNMDGVIDQPYGTDFYPVTAVNGWQQLSPVRSIHNRTWGLSYLSLSDAIAEAVDGDVIELDGGDITASGLYYDPVVIRKSITLRSTPGGVATLHPAHNLHAIHIEATQVTLQGLKFKGLAAATRYPVGVSMGDYIGGGFDNVSLLNNEFNGLYQAVAFTQSQGAVNIDDNLFTGNTYGLYFNLRYYTSPKTLTVTNNRFEQNTTAVTGGASPRAEKVFIYHNNFIDNANQSMPRGAQVPSYAIGGNYWSNIVVEDVNADGVIDKPYGSDFYPVTSESGWSGIVPVKAIHNITLGISYSSLSDAVEQAMPGDSIEVEGGVITGQGRYYDTVSIQKPLTLRAADRSAQLHAVHDLPAISINASDVVIDGFTITSYPNTSRYPVGVSVSDYLSGSYTGVELRNNHLKDMYQGIVFSMNSGSITIDSNTLENNTHGLYFSLRYYSIAKLIEIVENTFIDNVTAITGGATPDAEKVYVYNNNFIDNQNQAMPRGSQPVSYDTGGNHWSTLTSPDLLSGPGQDIAGSDGIVDVAYDSDAYPYVEPNGWQFQNTAPNAYLSVTAQVILGEDASFDASSSWDPEGFLVAYEFNFGNGQTYVEDVLSAVDGLFDGKTTYRYLAAGIYEATVTVTDTHGAQASAVAAVEVLSLADALGNLIRTIQDGGLAKGPENALVVKVKSAIKALARGDTIGAKQSLSDLMDQLQASGFCDSQTPEGFCSGTLPQAERIWLLL